MHDKNESVFFRENTTCARGNTERIGMHELTLDRYRADVVMSNRNCRMQRRGAATRVLTHIDKISVDQNEYGDIQREWQADKDGGAGSHQPRERNTSNPWRCVQQEEKS